MAYAFNPITGKLDDVGAAQVNSDWNAASGVAQILNKPTIPTATTDASLLTSGTLSDSRLSANVSLDNQNNNFSASQTFNGTANTAPNQTAASGTSLMTRDLVREFAIKIAQAETVIPLSLARVYATGTTTAGFYGSANNYVDLRTSTVNAGSVSTWEFNPSSNGLGQSTGGTRLRNDTPWCITLPITGASLGGRNAPNTISRISFTTAPSAVETFALPATSIGFGVQTVGNGTTSILTPFWLNGSGTPVTYATTDILSYQNNAQMSRLIFRHVGSGNIQVSLLLIASPFVVSLGTIVMSVSMNGAVGRCSAINNGTLDASTQTSGLYGAMKYMELSFV